MHSDLFPRYLGDEFRALPDAVQAGHRVGDGLLLEGEGKVTRGSSLWARLIAGLFRFPPATERTPVSVRMVPRHGGELWERQFGKQVFRSYLKVVDGRMTERFGPLTFTLGLHVAEERLHFPVRSGRSGPVPLPRWLLPISNASEYQKDGKFHFDVALHAPITGALMVHYQGWLEPRSGFGN
ncbi:protein of unknown function [Yoonia litorea]|uniref:DUF4166 domain-containing protein n=2 Tax=Yoonia litorea TaxID=1123755 RepID=A0A1I6LJQ3_9RHOB|nr:protein of unknown function [Yoonia litorea]